MDAGTTPGRYEIFERLGAGGMGEVFRARDRKLNRFVALKFLPAGASPAARERFEREAQAIAALNHPHICTLYETGEENGRACLVLELLEGETLQARLARGPLAGDALVEAALEIAEALEAAHKHGILHRDLKPSNIWVLPGGHVKILDFGLARLSGEALSDAATVGGEALLTSPGMAVGTAPYMSPEQARGEAIDVRSDIFSFGAVLYEMATGKAAFARPSSAATVAAILTGQPPLLAQLPPELERIVARCLEKDADLRYQTAADLRIELKRLKRSSSSAITGSTVAAAAPPAASSSSAWRYIAIAVVIAVVAFLAYWRVGMSSAPSAPPALSFRQLTFSGDVVDAAISADGRFLADVHIDPAGASLHLLSIANGSDVQIVPPGNDCCADPTIAPDDSAVYFLAGHTLESVPVLGGEVRAIAGPVCSGAGFSPDGSRIAYITWPQRGTNASRLVLAKADGSGAHTLAQTAAGITYTSSSCWQDSFNPDAPVWSPDGCNIAVVLDSNTSSGANAIGVVAVGTGKTTLLAAAGLDVGNLAWLPGGSAMTAAVSPESGGSQQLWRFAWPSGERTQLTHDLQGYESVTASSVGALALLHSTPRASVWVQSQCGGTFRQIPGGGGDRAGAVGLAWTPGGQLVVTRIYGSSGQLWQEGADGSSAQELVVRGLPGSPDWPVIAPDGDLLLEVGPGGLGTRAWWVGAAGGSATALTPDDVFGGLTLVDGGRELVYGEEAREGRQTLWEVPAAGGAPHVLWNHVIGFPAIVASPDESRILVSAHTGLTILHLDSGGKVAAATPAPPGAKGKPFLYGWTLDGRAITYVPAQGSVDNIWALPLVGGKPYALTHFTDLNITSYAFSRDGKLAVSRGSANTDVVLATGLGKR
ncbi:MAG: protein kinase domain-containing protein [Terriglobales bacterium]